MNTPPEKSQAKGPFRKTAFVVAALAVSIVLFYAEEDWRGSYALSRYMSQMEATNESFNPDRLIPPQVPDGQNLALIPFFTKSETTRIPETKVVMARHPTWEGSMAADLTNWSAAYGHATMDPVQAASNVLAAMNQQEPLLAELSMARERPSCWFDTDYKNWMGNTNLQSATLQQLAQIKRFFRVMSLHAQAELVAGQMDKALDDIELMFRVNDGLRDEPLVIAQLVGYASMQILLLPLTEGLAEHRWSEAQLRVLQDRLRRADLLASTVRAIDAERDFSSGLGANNMAVMPRGWSRLEQLNLIRATQDTVIPRVDLAARRIDPGVSRSCDAAVKNLSEGAFLHHRIIAAEAMPPLGSVCIHAAKSQTCVDEARVACALERFRSAEGHYPDALDDLVPRFESALPHDVINGQPLKYRVTSSGEFVLYSVGWNETDDGGKIVIGDGGSQDRMRGDWVFQYPNR